MYKKYLREPSTSIHRKKATVEGETLETKVKRIVNNKEPIKDGAPIIYTDRKDGVLPAYNVRTDRFELGLDATDYITRNLLAQRDANNKGVIDLNADDGNGNGEGESGA